MISRQRYHPFLRGINIRESLQLPSILSEIVAPSIGGTVHLCTLDAFYFIFREIPVNQTAFIFIKSYGIPSHSTCLENDSGQEELCGTLECENEREKGKKKKRFTIENGNDGRVAIQWLLFAFFFFRHRRCIVQNDGWKRGTKA